jgi:hypothetical protein
MERQVKELDPRISHRKTTDVAHIEIVDPLPSDPVEVLDAGDQLGFPGQVLIRFNPETGTVYGITIQGYSSFKRKLMWQNRTLRIQEAINALVMKVKELCGRQSHRLPALSH